METHEEIKNEAVIESGAVPEFIGFSGDRRIPKMNVSKESDAEFMRLLQKEDPERYARLMVDIRRDNPSTMSEEQALTNFMLGLSTGPYRFAVVEGCHAR